MEVVRDHHDNCIIICSIENVDPMGIHTGDSVTVAPALTLTDKEYQIMRDASIACLREIGVDTGGSNVQFAVDPETGRMVVIEMNPRVSRSSALASKATRFPIAKVPGSRASGRCDSLGAMVGGGAKACKHEPWFLRQIEQLVTIEAEVRAKGLPKDAQGLLDLKKRGFSAERLAELTGQSAADVAGKRR